MNLLKEVVEKVKYFPKGNPGIIVSIIKLLTIQIIPKGEFICQNGEIAKEMYFIMDGKAVVLMPSDETQVLAVLKKTDYFGEMGIMTGKA